MESCKSQLPSQDSEWRFQWDFNLLIHISVDIKQDSFSLRIKFLSNISISPKINLKIHLTIDSHKLTTRQTGSWTSNTSDRPSPHTSTARYRAANKSHFLLHSSYLLVTKKIVKFRPPTKLKHVPDFSGYPYFREKGIFLKKIWRLIRGSILSFVKNPFPTASRYITRPKSLIDATNKCSQWWNVR